MWAKIKAFQADCRVRFRLRESVMTISLNGRCSTRIQLRSEFMVSYSHSFRLSLTSFSNCMMIQAFGGRHTSWGELRIRDSSMAAHGNGCDTCRCVYLLIITELLRYTACTRSKMLNLLKGKTERQSFLHGVDHVFTLVQPAAEREREGGGDGQEGGSSTTALYN